LKGSNPINDLTPENRDDKYISKAYYIIGSEFRLSLVQIKSLWYCTSKTKKCLEWENSNGYVHRKHQEAITKNRRYHIKKISINQEEAIIFY